MSNDLIRSGVTRITGNDENVAASVSLVAGINRLATDSVESVNSGFSVAQKTITTTETLVAVGTSNQSGRKGVFIQNIGDECAYIGNTGVTTTTGLIICGGGTGMIFKFTENVSAYAISATETTTTLLICEVW